MPSEFRLYSLYRQAIEAWATLTLSPTTDVTEHLTGVTIMIAGAMSNDPNRADRRRENEPRAAMQAIGRASSSEDACDAVRSGGGRAK